MTAIPEGFWKDAKGCLVPESMIKPIDRTRDELAHDLGQRAKTMSASLRDFKTTVFNEINAFVDLSAEQYDVSWAGRRATSPCTASTARSRFRWPSPSIWCSTSAYRRQST